MRWKKNWSCTLQNRQQIHKMKNLLFLLPSLAGVTFFVMAPFAKVVVSSFCTAMSGEFVGIKNYITVFHNTAFRLAAANTLRFMAAGLPLLLILSLGLALMIYRKPAYDKYKYLYLLPMAVPAATMVLVWKLLFSEQGFLNRALETHVDFLGEKSAFVILVISYLWKNLGYTVVLWLAGLKSIPGEIIDAAKVDGAGKVQVFFKVTLPCLKGSMFTILVVSILNSFKAFREVYLVGGAYPQKSIYMIQNVFNNWYVNLEQDKLAAGAVLLVAVLGTVSFLLRRQWDRED
ncbi:MAG: sugar ABC transporter permease [Acetatifactor sp.]|nr:sugar ABC transporter permease [Acetatifactor sp.]